jgi:hypothetical protein
LLTDDISLLVVNLKRSVALALCRRRLSQRLRDFRPDLVAEDDSDISTSLFFAFRQVTSSTGDNSPV